MLGSWLDTDVSGLTMARTRRHCGQHRWVRGTCSLSGAATTPAMACDAVALQVPVCALRQRPSALDK
jgi:hypothetical protein